MKRPIRKEEITLLKHLLELAVREELHESIPTEVEEYNPKQKESVNLSGTDAADYGGDLLRVEYTDEDEIVVTITLTKNKEGDLLDLDFWKEGFIPVIQYPSPEQVKIVR